MKGGLLQTKIFEQVLKYIPSIKIMDVRSSTSEDQHTVSISLTYNYTLDNSEDTIQLNFR